MTKFYCTQQGLQKLKADLAELKTKGRGAIAQQIAEATSQGDLSENAAYDAAKEAQETLENQIIRLEREIAQAYVVDESDLDTSRVALLSSVAVTNTSTNQSHLYKLVPVKEIDLKKNRISIESPIAQGLIGKAVGDVALIATPAGTLSLRVDRIFIE